MTWAGRARRCGAEGGFKHCEGQVVAGGGWRGRAPQGTRMRGGSSDRPITAGEAETVSKRRQERLKKNAAGKQLVLKLLATELLATILIAILTTYIHVTKTLFTNV
jgi:hypothetical protein